MSVFTKCGPDCPHCDCGRSENKCKFAAAKQRGRKKALGLAAPTKVKKKRSKRGKRK